MLMGMFCGPPTMQHDTKCSTHAQKLICYITDAKTKNGYTKKKLKNEQQKKIKTKPGKVLKL